MVRGTARAPPRRMPRRAACCQRAKQVKHGEPGDIRGMEEDEVGRHGAATFSLQAMPLQAHKAWQAFQHIPPQTTPATIIVDHMLL